MRFDDRLVTVLAQPTPDTRASAVQWRQLVDLLAQHRGGEGAALIDAAFAVLAEKRLSIAIGERVAAARSLVGQSLPPRLLAFFAADHAAVSAPILRGVRLGAEEWLAVLPGLGPTARALLRHRDDLDPAVLRGLESFGASDLVIEAPASADSTDGASNSQIRDLVDRIEAFRQQRDSRVDEPSADPAPAGAVDDFRWESGIDGVIDWLDGATRGAVVGQSLAAGGPDRPCVAEAVSAAFAARRGFRDLTLLSATGEHWWISGVPVFEGASGRFLGYRGTARRPRAGEGPATLGATGLAGPDMREMVHELRTPLNAIIGFAELIDGQFLGPAGERSRARAGDIRSQAQRLIRALEDLDLAARLDSGRIESADGSADLAALVRRMHDIFEPEARSAGAGLRVAIAPDLPAAALPADEAERLISRLFEAVIGAAGPGETVEVRLFALDGWLVLALTPPTALREDAGEGVGKGGDRGDDSGLPLGIGFALRLVRNLARAAGGDFEPEAAVLRLKLPIDARAAMPGDCRP